MAKYDTKIKKAARLETWRALFHGYSREEVAQLRIVFMPDENAFDAAVLIGFGASPKNIVGVSDAFPKDFAERPGKKAALTKICGVSFRVFGGKLSEAAVAFEEERLQFDIAFLDFCGNVRQNGIRNEIEMFMFVMAPTARVAVNHLKGRETGIMDAIKKVGREAMVFASVNRRKVNNRRIPDAPMFTREPLATGEYWNNRSSMAWYVWGRIDTSRKRYSRVYNFLNSTVDLERKSELNRQWRMRNPERVRANRRLAKKTSPERDRMSKQRWYANNREAIRETARKKYKENFEKICENNQRWRIENPEKVRAQRKRYKAKYSDKIREANRLYREKNQEDIREKRRQRYAKETAK